MVRVSTNPKHLTEEIVGKWHQYTNSHTRWFVFTDNKYSFDHTPHRKGQGQAVVRGLDGTLSIFTKESYVYREYRKNVNRERWDKDYEELALFQKHNTPRLKAIKELSMLSTEEHIQEIILPQQFAGDKAFLTQPCAKWLKAKLNDLVPYSERYKVHRVQGQNGWFLRSVLAD